MGVGAKMGMMSSAVPNFPRKESLRAGSCPPLLFDPNALTQLRCDGEEVSGTIELIKEKWDHEKGKPSAALNPMCGEWEEKYGFVIGLLRNPLLILKRKSLEHFHRKLRRQLSASKRQRSSMLQTAV